MNEVTIVFPECSDDKISADLRYLTESLMTQGSETTGGFLGGEYGYGAYFENDTFMMHPYCWCEQDDCLWCLACTCEFDYGWQEPPSKQCDKCIYDIKNAPNFHHKPTGTKVWWYKYIGRGMDVALNGDWIAIFNECLESARVTDPL